MKDSIGTVCTKDQCEGTEFDCACKECMNE
jgi:hypothetical protein